MQDYLLVQGPPGTGKTSVIAEIIKRLCQQGQRVLLAGFTNQAVDNMLKRLDKEGVHDYLRLGHERSVDESIRPRLLKALVETRLMTNEVSSAEGSAEQTEEEEENALPQYADLVLDLLRSMPIVASTTATWSSDKYAPQQGDS